MPGSVMMQYVTKDSLKALEEMYEKYYASESVQEAPEVERMDASDMSFVVYTTPYDGSWFLARCIF